MNHENHLQLSLDGSTVWVHSPLDGSTVGRFSRRFGMDIHTTITQQLAGASQCLHCTHTPAGETDWHEFVQLMRTHHDIEVPVDMMQFQAHLSQTRDHPRPR